MTEKKKTSSRLSAENRQNDWFTGIQYYTNDPVKKITVCEKKASSPTDLALHDQVFLIYVRAGKGIVEINGTSYPAAKGTFFCLYTHHLYRIAKVMEPLEFIRVGFYIGMFMYMSWEKHPRNANAALVYDTCPALLSGSFPDEPVKRLFDEISEESRHDRFESGNLIAYKTLELHALFCRHTYELINRRLPDKSPVWGCVEKLLLCTEKELSLFSLASEQHCTPQTLNSKIKRVCGLTAPQLRILGRIWNAQALLWFPELSVEYISSLNGFSSVQDFCRAFARWCGQSPEEYRRKKIYPDRNASGAEVGMQLLQYLHLHFPEPLTEQTLAEALCVRPKTVKRILREHFDTTLPQLLDTIRVRYACSLLHATSLTVLHISESCGFTSYASFRRAFLLEMGETPSSYRKHEN